MAYNFSKIILDFFKMLKNINIRKTIFEIK